MIRQAIAVPLPIFTGKYPVVSIQTLRWRFDNNCWHKGVQSPTLNYSGIPSGVENGAAGAAATWTGRPKAE